MGLGTETFVGIIKILAEVGLMKDYVVAIYYIAMLLIELIKARKTQINKQKRNNAKHKKNRQASKLKR